MSILARAMLALMVLVTLTGCSSIYRTTGWFAYDFTEDYAIPFTMQGDDPELACSMTSAMSQLLMTFTELTYTPDRAAVTMNMMMGSCAEERAQEEVLAYFRAFKAQNINEAKDARIREKRIYAMAADRQYKAYKHMVAEFGEPGGQCPKLKADREIFWVLGNIAGMQAVMSDLRSQSVVNVPKDIAMKAVRGMQCVDNIKWWGLPQALQAGLWIMMPDTGPKGVDPWAEMQNASAIATASGVRMVHAIEVVIADGAGDQKRLRDAIRNHAASLKLKDSNPKYRMMDLVASRQVLAASDRLWTEGTGARTPVGSFGTFWDDAKKPINNLNIDDLLGD